MFQIKVLEKIKVHILHSVTFFPENLAVYEITSKNMVEPERPQMTIRRRVACWIRLQVRKHTPMHPHPHTRAHRNMQYLLLFHGNSGFVNVSQCYVIRTLAISLQACSQRNLNPPYLSHLH